MKLTLVHLMTHYDIKLEKGEDRPKDWIFVCVFALSDLILYFLSSMFTAQPIYPIQRQKSFLENGRTKRLKSTSNLHTVYFFLSFFYGWTHPTHLLYHHHSHLRCTITYLWHYIINSFLVPVIFSLQLSLMAWLFLDTFSTRKKMLSVRFAQLSMFIIITKL